MPKNNNQGLATSSSTSYGTTGETRVDEAKEALVPVNNDSSQDQVVLQIPVLPPTAQDAIAESLEKDSSPKGRFILFMETVKLFGKRVGQPMIEAADSKFAAVNTASIATDSSVNTVTSTFTDVLLTERLLAVEGAALFIFTAGITAVLLQKHFKGETYNKTVDKLIKNAPTFMFNFNAIYIAGTDVAAKILANKTVSLSDPGVIAGVSSLIATSLAFGIIQCYGLEQAQSSIFFKAANKVSFALTLGNFLRDCIRAYNTFMSNDGQPSVTEEALSYASLALSAVALIGSIRATINPSWPRRIAACNAVIYQGTTVLVALKSNDNAAQVLSLTDLGMRMAVAGGMLVLTYNTRKQEQLLGSERLLEENKVSEGKDNNEHTELSRSPSQNQL